MNSRILSIFALVVATGIFFGYVNPAWTGSIAEVRAEIARTDQALASARDYSLRQNELAQERSAIDPANLERLSAFLPDSVDNVGIILDLNALAARSGLSLSNIDVAATASNEGSASPVGSVDLSLTAVGTYAGLQSFLKGVEQSLRLLDVRLLSVAGSDTGVYTYRMTLRLYWLR